MPQPEDPQYLLKQVERCRKLAHSTLDEKARKTLLGMAREYQERADAITAKHKPATEP